MRQPNNSGKCLSQFHSTAPCFTTWVRYHTTTRTSPGHRRSAHAFDPFSPSFLQTRLLSCCGFQSVECSTSPLWRRPPISRPETKLKHYTRTPRRVRSDKLLCHSPEPYTTLLSSSSLASLAYPFIDPIVRPHHIYRIIIYLVCDTVNIPNELRPHCRLISYSNCSPSILISARLTVLWMP